MTTAHEVLQGGAAEYQFCVGFTHTHPLLRFRHNHRSRFFISTCPYWSERRLVLSQHLVASTMNLYDSRGWSTTPSAGYDRVTRGLVRSLFPLHLTKYHNNDFALDYQPTFRISLALALFQYTGTPYYMTRYGMEGATYPVNATRLFFLLHSTTLGKMER